MVFISVSSVSLKALIFCSFSMVRKIKTETRSELDNSTVVKLLSVKINQEEECWQAVPSAELCSKAKSATWEYNKRHPTIVRRESV